MLFCGSKSSILIRQPSLSNLRPSFNSSLTIWFAKPLKNCPSLVVALPSLSNNLPHFWSIVDSSVVEYVRPAVGRLGNSRAENRTPAGFSSGLRGGDRIGSAVYCGAFVLVGNDGDGGV